MHQAALVEETNAAIEQTEAQASELDRVIGVFTIGGGTVMPLPAGVGARGSSGRGAYRAQGNAAIDRDWPKL